MILPLEDYLTRLRTTITPLFDVLATKEAQALWSLLPAFETVVAENAGSEGTIPYPYSPPPGFETSVIGRAKSSGLREAPVHLVFDQLLVHLHAAGLFRRSPNPLSLRRQRDLAVNLTPEVWDVAVRLSWRDQRTPTPTDDESDLIRAVLESLILEDHLAIPGLPRIVVSLTRDAINWQEGWLIVPLRSTGTRAARPHRERFVLSTATRLNLGRLQLFYTAHPELRPSTYPGLLGPNWKDPARIRTLLRAMSCVSLDSRTILRGGAVLGLLSRGPVLLSRRIAHLLTTDAPSADLQKLGFHGEDPLIITQQSRHHHFPRDGVTSSFTCTTHSAAPEAERRVRRLLRSIADAATASQRRELAQGLHEARCEFPEVSNLGLVAEYAVFLLDQPDIKPRTVRNKISGLASAVDAVLDGASILTCDTAAALTDLTAELIFAYDAAGTQKVMRQRLCDWFCFIRSAGHPLPPIDMHDPELTVLDEGRCLPLLAITDYERATCDLREVGRPDALALSTAVVVAAYGGLRRYELCVIPLNNVPADPRWTFSIQESKSVTGRRHVPLALSAPSVALTIVKEYHQQRLTLGRHDEPWLLTPEGKPWDPDRLSALITRVLRRVSGNPAVVFHSLRRAAATWLLVRWCAGQGWPVELALQGRWAKEAFSAESLGRVQELLGTGTRRVLWQLASLLGHQSPEVTLSHYVAATDWLETFQPRPSRRDRMSYREAAAMLGIAPRYAYECLGRDFSEQVVLREQVARIEDRAQR